MLAQTFHEMAYIDPEIKHVFIHHLKDELPPTPVESKVDHSVHQSEPKIECCTLSWSLYRLSIPLPEATTQRLHLLSLWYEEQARLSHKLQRTICIYVDSHMCSRLSGPNCNHCVSVVFVVSQHSIWYVVWLSRFPVIHLAAALHMLLAIVLCRSFLVLQRTWRTVPDHVPRSTVAQRSADCSRNPSTPTL